MRSLLLVTIGAAAAMTLFAGAAAASASRGCPAPQTVTVASNSQVRVFSRPSRYGGGRLIYACYRESGRRTFLHDVQRGELTSMSKIRLAGRFVAYDILFGCDRHYGDCGGIVEVVDVRRGKRTNRLVSQDIFLAGDEPSKEPVLTDLALQPSGSAALILGPNEWGELEVWNLRADGGKARLDYSPDVEPGSLAMSRAWIYWRRSGQPQSARTASLRR